MNITLMKGLSTHECLSGTYANVGLCDFYSCTVNVYFYVLLTKKDRPRITLAGLRTILFSNL